MKTSLLIKSLVVLFVFQFVSASGVVFTNDTLISSGNTNYDGQEIVISSCTVTVDGPHTFASLHVTTGGRLMHSGSANGVITQFSLVPDEPLVLSDTNAATLANSNVVVSSVQVRDNTGAIIYSNTVDYLIVVTNSFATIQRTDTSAIPDGATVLVSYEYAAGTANAELNLTITERVEVEPGAVIDVNGRGYGGNFGPGFGGQTGSPTSGGGAGHGGYGGLSSSNAPGGNAYGSLSAPTILGSGGGSGLGGLGGNGGGLVRLNVNGLFLLNGTITANGADAINSRAGGGAGGSIWITAQTFSGTGTLAANGGAGEPVHGGGGGGGRIAVQFQPSSFTGTISAVGGAGAQRGGAGTVFLQTNGTPGQVIFDNGGFVGAATLMQLPTGANLTVQGRALAVASSSQTIGNLLVRSNASLTTTVTNNATLTLTIQSNATIEPGSAIVMDGKGFPQNQGTGMGGISGTSGGTAGGAGHGGYGGNGQSGSLSPGGIAYGSLTGPATWGSGGRSILPYSGGAGGGAVRMIVTGNLHMDGKISTDATGGTGVATSGGSGGSIWLTLGGFSGSGLISANGGSGAVPNGGGGAGGRIAITYSSNSFTGTLVAKGGTGAMAGGAGTIYTKGNSEAHANFRADNGGLSGANTLFDAGNLYNITVTGGASVRSVVSTLTLGSLTIASNSSLLLTNSSTFTLTVNSNFTVAEGGAISANGAILGGSGSGLSSTSLGSGGGGHGGYGGRGAGALGGNAYGSPANPTNPGSPGGSGTSTPGGYGGAALRLTVNGPAMVDGKIAAVGWSGPTNNAGGGSGGSIWLTVNNQLSGSGVISADGGAGFLPNGGGGGGGRVAIFYNTNSFTGTFSAKGGNGFVPGGAGTIYLKQNNQSLATFIADNGGLVGTNTLIDISSSINLSVGSGAVLVPINGLSTMTVNNLTIASNATFQFGTLTLTVTSNATVAAGGKISGDGRGFFGTGLGLGLSGLNGSGGGGHAGSGGNGAGLDQTGRGGITYDSASAPSQPGGSGGGVGSTGGPGGGAFRMTVNGLLNLAGTISANGFGTSTNNAGGGAGGSLWLTVGDMIGSGSISANGGSGHLPLGGGGGGGRVAVIYNNKRVTNLYAGTMSAKGGAGFFAGGAGTIYVFTNFQANVAQVLLDNGGIRGTNTSVSVTSGSYDLIIQGGATAASIGSPRDLLIRSNGWVVQTGSISVTRNISVETGGAINLDGLVSGGAGTGYSSANPRGGGGHGGHGALNPGGSFGAVYGSVTSPITSGSPGGNASGTSTAPFGGYGGGALWLTVPNTLLVNGTISANGGNGDFNSGGGSGGSVRLTVGTLAGTGSISANGGIGNGQAGGGGGGRVAITYFSNLFNGTISACGGAGAQAGGAGTVYLKSNTSPSSSLLVDNCGLIGTNTPLSPGFGLASNIVVTGGAVAEMQGSIPLLQSLAISSGAKVIGRVLDTNLFLAVQGDMLIDWDSALAVDSKGYSRGNGPGVGGTLSSKGAGGGYGGTGGDSASGALGGIDYGLQTLPAHRGSGGGSGFSSPIGGSEGGGAIRLTIGGTLLVNGRIGANGGTGLQDDSGGGAGGSVWVTASSLTGGGSIEANGGDGEMSGGGGGGGGRIALYSPMNTFTGLVSVVSGTGAFPGNAGSTHTSVSLLPFGVTSHSPTGVVSNVVSQVTLEFNSPINPTTLSAANVAIITPKGPMATTNIGFSLLGLTTLRITFPAQNTPGDYQFEVGPALQDLLGQTMSQVYTGTFSVALPVISGIVTATNNQPVSGVVLQPSGGLISVMTDLNGTYSFGVPLGWTGTVTPALPGWTFAPGTRGYTNVQDTVTNQNYLLVSTLSPSLEFGRVGTNIALSWHGLRDVSYQTYWSTNLTDWNPSGAPIFGTNGLIELLLPITDDPARFFRVGAQN